MTVARNHQHHLVEKDTMNPKSEPTFDPSPTPTLRASKRSLSKKALLLLLASLGCSGPTLTSKQNMVIYTEDIPFDYELWDRICSSRPILGSVRRVTEGEGPWWFQVEPDSRFTTETEKTLYHDLGQTLGVDGLRWSQLTGLGVVARRFEDAIVKVIEVEPDTNLQRVQELKCTAITIVAWKKRVVSEEELHALVILDEDNQVTGSYTSSAGGGWSPVEYVPQRPDATINEFPEMDLREWDPGSLNRTQQ